MRLSFWKVFQMAWRQDEPILNVSGPLSRLGKSAAQSSTILVPMMLVLSFTCMIGVTSVRFMVDVDWLFVPEQARGLSELDSIQEHFPSPFENYHTGHELHIGPEVNVIITAKDGGTMLRSSIWDQILDLNFNLSQSFGIRKSGRIWKYPDLCAKRLGDCAANIDILDLYPVIQKTESEDLRLPYPILEKLQKDNYFYLPQHLGGVEVNDKDEIINVKAVRLDFPIDPNSSGENKIIPLLWEASAVEANGFFNYSLIDVIIMSTKRIERALVENIDGGAMERIPYGIALIIGFSIFAGMHHEDPRPFFYLFGVFNIICAIFSAWGLLIHLFGVPWQSINQAAIFLLLGVGLDDIFVMSNAWKRTRKDLPLEDRLAECYGEAATSITITSATNICSFLLGLTTEFRCVKIFCLYTAAGMAALYLWTLLLFGPGLTWDFYGDRHIRHLFARILPSPYASSKSSSKDNSSLSEHFKSSAFTVYGNHILRRGSILVILAVLVAYLASAVFYIIRVEEGLRRRNLAKEDSLVVQFYDMEDLYFRDYPYRIQIALTDDGIRYWDPEIQSKVFAMLQEVKTLPFIDNRTEFEENWLEKFLDYATEEGLDVSTQEAFIYELVFFMDLVRHNPLANDIRLDHNKTRILASRFLFQTRDLRNAVDEAKMVNSLRSVVDKHSESIGDIRVFHKYFPFFDQFIQVLPNTLFNLGIGCAAMIGITALLISNFTSIFWVALSMISIEAGVFGYMVMWGIQLDVISMISLIMCIGFSVDFCAHIANHFVRAKAKGHKERIIESISVYGVSIVDSAISTVLGLSVLFLPSYILSSFSKMMILVITFGVLHGLVFLPVGLALMSFNTCKNHGRREYKVNEPLRKP